VAVKPPPMSRSEPPVHQKKSANAALALPQRDEPLVSDTEGAPDLQTPLPRNLSLVDSRLPLTRRVRLWAFRIAERWVERRKPLPEQPTIAQLEKLRKELALVQRKLDKMLG